MVGKEGKEMTNRQRTVKDIERTTKEVIENNVEPVALTNWILSIIAVELAGINDELYTLKLNKQTNEVGELK